MAEKINNVISSLRQFPGSKRAVITIPYSSEPSSKADHTNDEQAKCLRELHFYIEDERLHCTGFMRAQAAIIFPKNIHYIGTIQQMVADALKVPAGSYVHFVTTLVNDRS
jgi:thymidylate synthase